MTHPDQARVEGLTKADPDSIRILQQFAERNRDGINSCEMDGPSAQAVALSIEDALSELLALRPAVGEAEPAGEWKLVPVEPSEEMMDAWDNLDPTEDELPSSHIRRVWSAMLAAAPIQGGKP